MGLDDEPRPGGFTTEAVAGMRRTISAAAFQATAAGFLRFVGWAHGGAASQQVSLPSSDVTYTALYAASGTYVDTFGNATGSRMQPRSGAWVLDATGAYTVGGRPNADDAVALLTVTPPRPAAYEVGVTVSLANSLGNAFLIFDAVAVDDFKYVGLRGAAGTLVVGRRTPGGWSDEAAIAHGLDVAPAVQLTAQISGSQVTARLGERVLLSHDFGEPLGEGTAGLATRKGLARFTRFFETAATHPRDVLASGMSLPENSVPGTLAGVLASRGWGSGASFRYAPVAGEGDADNAAFVIRGDRIEAGRRFNFEERRTATVRVRSIEATGVVSENPLTITIADVADEQPVIESLIPPAGGLAGVGAVLRFTVVLSCAVQVTGQPRLPLRLGGVARAAVYEGGSGTHRLTFAYRVKATDPSGAVAVGDGVRLPARSSVQTPSGRRLAVTLPTPGLVLPGVRIDTAAATAVGWLEGPPAGVYAQGGVVRFRVTFSEVVRVTGAPRIRLTLGGRGARTVAAVYEGGSGTTVLTFRYDVKAEDAMRLGSTVVVSTAITLPTGSAIVDAAANAAKLAVRVPASLRIRFGKSG